MRWAGRAKALGRYITYIDGTGQSSAGEPPVHGRIRVGRVTAYPVPVKSTVGWVSSKTAEASRLQMRGLETTSAARRSRRVLP